MHEKYLLLAPPPNLFELPPPKERLCRTRKPRYLSLGNDKSHTLHIFYTSSNSLFSNSFIRG